MVFIPCWEKYKDKKPSGLVEINYAHELARGLKVAMMPEAGMQNLAIETLTTSTNPLVTNEEQQKNWIFDRSTDTTIDTKYSNSSITEHSCFLITRHRLLTSGNNEFYIGNRVSGNKGFNFYTSNPAGVLPDQTYRLGYVHGGIAVYESTYTISGSNTRFLSVGFFAKIGSAVDYYVDGKNIDSKAIGGITNNSDSLRVGKDVYFNGSYLHNEMPVLYYFDRQLSDSEFESLNEAPYQILKPRQSFFVFGGAAGTQTLTPSVVTNANTFYTATVTGGTQALTPSLVANTNTFETATVTTQNTLTASVVTNTSSFYSATVVASNSLQPSVVANTQTFHDVTVTTANSLVVDLYANSASFHNATVTTSNNLQASLVTNSPSFYSADVTPSNSLQASLLTNTQTFHTPVVSLEGAQVVAPNLLTNEQSFYTATVSTGAVSVTAPLVINNQTFYTANVSTGTIVLTPDTVTNTQSFYSATLTTNIAIQPSLVANSQTFHPPVVSLEGAKTLVPSLVTNTSSFYNATITTGSVGLLPSLVNNTTTFHTTTVTQVDVLEPTLVTNTPSFYTHVVSVGTATINPSLFSNSNVFYSADVALGAALQTLQPSLITNTNVFYNGTVTFDQTLDAELFVNQPTFYTHLIYDAALYKEVIEFSVSITQLDSKSMSIQPEKNFNLGL